MTHFLGRLVGRVQGTTPRIEPMLSSRFAPVSSTDISPPSATRIRQSSYDPVTPPEIEIPLPEAQSVSRTQVGIESGSIGKHPRICPPVAIEIESSTRDRDRSGLISVDATEGPAKVFREELLVPQFQEDTFQSDEEHTRPSTNPPPAVVPESGEERNLETAQPAPIALVAGGEQWARIFEHRLVPNERGGELIASPQLSVSREQAGNHPNERQKSEIEQQPVTAPEHDLVRLAEPTQQENGRHTMPRKRQPLASISTRRVSPLAMVEKPAEQTPIVRVTIGRIEVHAESAPTPSPRKSTNRPAPRLTLDNYLKSRKGVTR